MIKLLRLPAGNITRLITRQMLSYGAVHQINLWPGSISKISNIPGYIFYRVYRNNILIGIISGMEVDEYWVGDMLYLEPRYRRYLKEVILSIDSMARSFGLRGLIVHPDKHTANVYTKHNLAKEI